MANIQTPYIQNSCGPEAPENQVTLPLYNSWQTVKAAMNREEQGKCACLPKNTYKIIGEGLLGLLWIYKLFIFAVLIEKSWRRLMHLGSVFTASKRLNPSFVTVQSFSFWKRYYSPTHRNDTRSYHLTPFPLFQTQWVQDVTNHHSWSPCLERNGAEYSHEGISKDSLVLIPTNWLGDGATVYNQLCLTLNLSLHPDLMRKFFFWKKIIITN